MWVGPGRGVALPQLALLYKRVVRYVESFCFSSLQPPPSPEPFAPSSLIPFTMPEAAAKNVTQPQAATQMCALPCIFELSPTSGNG